MSALVFLKYEFDAFEIRRDELKAQLSTLNFHRFLMNHNTLIAIQPQNKL
jgi:hypothetical protein